MFGRKTEPLVAWEGGRRQFSDFTLWFSYEHLIMLSKLKKKKKKGKTKQLVLEYMKNTEDDLPLSNSTDNSHATVVGCIN